MLAVQRRREILNRLDDSGSVRVTELADKFTVTEETIRRDLHRLDQEGRLVRIHGGAVSIHNDRRELPLEVRETINLDEKKAIAALAVKQIQEGDVIALDASSSARELAKTLPDFPLTVVTNCMAIAGTLTHQKYIRVLSTGGLLDGPSSSFVGPLAELALQRFSVAKLFISCKGVDLDRGLSVALSDHAAIKRKMIDLSDKVFLLVDSSKFGAKSVEFFCDLAEIDCVFTDAGVPAAAIRAMEKGGVALEIAALQATRKSPDGKR